MFVSILSRETTSGSLDDLTCNESRPSGTPIKQAALVRSYRHRNCNSTDPENVHDVPYNTQLHHCYDTQLADGTKEHHATVVARFVGTHRYYSIHSNQNTVDTGVEVAAKSMDCDFLLQN